MKNFLFALMLGCLMMVSPPLTNATEYDTDVGVSVDVGTDTLQSVFVYEAQAVVFDYLYTAPATMIAEQAPIYDSLSLVDLVSDADVGWRNNENDFIVNAIYYSYFRYHRFNAGIEPIKQC